MAATPGAVTPVLRHSVGGSSGTAVCGAQRGGPRQAAAPSRTSAGALRRTASRRLGWGAGLSR